MRPLLWTVAWCLAISLLISPYSRKAHFVMLLPATLLVGAHVLRAGLRPAAAPACWLFLSLLIGQLTAPWLLGRDAATYLLALGVIGGSAMAILPAMWMIRSGHGQL